MTRAGRWGTPLRSAMEFRSYTKMEMKRSPRLEAWNRLSQGKNLDGLSLETREGRVDLSGLILPGTSRLRRYQTAIANVEEIKPGAVIRGVKWKDFDFADSKLNGVRFFDCEIRNCRFDECQLRDFRVWSSKFSETTFRGADLAKAALGGVQDGRRNSFFGVDFTEADLSQSMYMAASFERCIFRNAKLVKVDFQTSTFSDCEFEGELREVVFNRRGFRGEAFPANEMINVDFSKAKLHFVEFRGLSLARVRLPDDAEHVVIKNYTSALDGVIEVLRSQHDRESKTLLAYLASCRKWTAPDQFQGVLSIQDLKEIAGEDATERVLDLFRRVENRIM
jgi:fluoroquinolone resistance protein